MTPGAGGTAQTSERRILFLVGAVQFVNILDFMIVMPLGPDFAAGLGISMARLGLVGGSYTVAAAVAGLVAAAFLDRFDRRSALAVSMLGLVLATAAGGLATGLPSLLAARIAAGLFGGPAASLSLSIVADVIPPHRRGKAMGAVMGAFSVASVLGVPAGLELARHGGWQLPFFAVAALGLAVAASAVFLMPPLRAHLDDAGRGRPPEDGVALLKRPMVLLSLAAMAVTMMSSFAIIPNLSAYIQFNAGYPRDGLGFLYLVGGVVSFAMMRLAGMMVDRIGATAVAAMGTAILLAVLLFGFVHPVAGLPVLAIFVAFMISGSLRGVTLNALASRVPQPHERARFMSVQSSVQHLAAAAGGFLSAQILHELPDHRLQGMPGLAIIAMLIGITLPLLLWLVERGIGRRDAPMNADARSRASLRATS